MNKDEIKELRETMSENVQDLYPAVEKLTVAIAEKTGKKQEIIDFITENKPTTSDLIIYLGDIDEDDE